MRILFVNRLLGILWGGGESFDYHIAQTLARMGHETTVLTGKPLSRPPVHPLSDIRRYFVSTPYLRRFCYTLSGRIPKLPIALLRLDLYWFENAAFRWIAHHRHEFDCVQILSMPRLAWKVTTKLDLPTISWFPGPPSERWDFPYISRLAQSSRATMFTHGDTLNIFESRNLPIANIPPGVDGNVFCRRNTDVRKHYNLSDQDILFLFCGRLVPGKGIQFLINGFREVADRNPKAKLMILGEGPIRPILEEQTASLRLTDRVIFTGKVDNIRLADFYSAGDVFALVSPYESYGIVVAEAMACGLPIIATNVGGLPLHVEDGINGYLVEYGDTASLSHRMLQLAGAPDLRATMGESNRQKILRNCNWERSGQAIIRLAHNITIPPKRKVAFVIPDLGKGGAERVLATLLDHFDRDKFEPSCIFYDSNHVYPLPEGIKTFNLNLPGTPGVFQKAFRLLRRIEGIRKILRREKPDLVFSFINSVNLTVILVRSLFRIPVALIVSEHNTPSLQLKGVKGRLTGFLMRWLYPKADGVVAVSEGVKNDLIRNYHIPPDKVNAIYNPVDIERIQALAREPVTECDWFNEDIPVLINVGTLAEQKGQKHLLRAFKLIREQVSCRLVILGEGEYEAELRQLAVDLGIDRDVQFLGFRNNPFKFIARSSVFVLSSLWEGLSMGILEAMVCNVPVVSTDCPCGPNEIIDHGINGFLVPVRDEQQIARAVLDLLQNPQLHETIRAGQKGKILQFSHSRILHHYHRLFEEHA